MFSIDLRLCLKKKGTSPFFQQQNLAKGLLTTSLNFALVFLVSAQLASAQGVDLQTRVWNDVNGDGIQNNGENGGVSGVSVELFNADGSSVLSTTTGSNGVAMFTGLAPNTNYRLKYTRPGNHAFTGRKKGSDRNKDSDAKGDGTTDLFRTGAAGQNFTSVDAGLWAPGTVTTRVWNDVNGDGIQNNGENGGIEKVLVELLDVNNGNTVIGSDMTASNGVASIGNVPADRPVRLRYTLPADHKFTDRKKGSDRNKDSDAKGDGTTDQFSASKGSQSFTSVDAGMWAPGTVTTRVWNDVNGDGIQNNGENGGIANVKVELLDVNDNDAVLEYAMTGTNGVAIISGVPANRPVRLKYYLPADHKFTGRKKGSDVNKDSDAKGDGTTDQFSASKGGQSFTSVDAGMWVPGTVTTRVWNDVNGDGIQNNGENGGISGVRVELLDVNNNDALLKYAMTGTNGQASISEVPADRPVRLKYILPADHKFTGRKQGSDVNKDSDAKGDGTTDQFSTSKGSQAFTSVDAGMWAPGTVTTRVWDDVNGDGIQNNGENGGIENIKVELLDVNNSNAVLSYATTGTNGQATFNNVPADRPVKLKYILPADHKFTGRKQGSNTSKDSDAKGDGTTDQFSANRGSQSFTSVDAGMWTPGQVIARVWIDQNGDGIQNNGENGPNTNVFGVRVNLIETNGNPVRRPNGSEVWALTACGTGLATLDYVPANRPVKLEFVKFSGGVFAPRNSGSNEDKDSDAKGDGTTDQFSATRGNQTFTNQDAGFTTRGSWDDAGVTVLVWDDVDGNGVQSNSEKNSKGIGNVKVRLTDNSGNTCFCDRTANNGQVTLPAIGGRDYRIKVDLPTDHAFTPRTGGLSDPNNSDINPGNGQTNKFSIAGGETITYIDAGLWAPGKVTALAWDDVDGNGIQSNSEKNSKGLDGITVHLTETNGTIIQTTTTGTNGKAVFNNVPADRELRLKFVLPTDHAFTPQSGNIGDANNSDANPSTGSTGKFKADRGSDHNDFIDAGMWAPGKVTALVWDDVDGNGIQSNSEKNSKGLDGITVHLTETNNAIIQTTTTGTNGRAVFNNVPADRELRLKFVLPADHAFTLQNGAVTNVNNNDANRTTGVTGKFRADRGSDHNDFVDAGMWTPGTVTALVWNDVDANGIQSNSEKNSRGIDGVTVHLTETNSGNIIETTTTMNGGKAVFNNVPADRELRLKFVTPAGHRFTIQNGAITNANNSDASPTTGVTGKFRADRGNESIDYVDAGMWAPATVTAFVWDDINGDGVQSNSEKNSRGIDGVTVHLTGSNSGDIIDTKTTMNGGKAVFTNVPADRELRLKFVLPVDHQFTEQNGAITNPNNSDANRTTGVTGKFSASKGSDKITYVDAGLWTPGQLDVLVWEDDGNGIQSNSEKNSKGASGVTVNLLETNNSPVFYPTGHPNAGMPVTGVSNGSGKATIDYVPADRELRVEFVAPGIGATLTIQNGLITNSNNSDANPSTGITSKFKVDQGNETIAYIDAGYTDLGILPPTVLPGFSSTTTKKGQARWRNFRSGGNGWEVGVGTDVGGNSSTFNNNDFNNAADWFFDPSSNEVKLEYDPNAGTLRTTTAVNSKVFTASYPVGNLGNVNYMQWFVRGQNTSPDPQTIEFFDVVLTVNGNAFPLGDFEAKGVGKNWFINYDLSSGFALTGKIRIIGSATGQEQAKVDISIGREGANIRTAGSISELFKEETITTDFTAFPSPATSQVTARLTSEAAGVASLQVVDLTGRVLTTQPWELFEGQNETVVPLTGLADGQYFLVVTSDQFVVRKPIVVLKR